MSSVLARVLLLGTLTMVLGAQLTTASTASTASTSVVTTYQVEVEGEDDFGNKLGGTGIFHRQPRPNSQIDDVYFACEVHVVEGVAAAVGVGGGRPDAPSNTDGCHLRHVGNAVRSAPGVGVPGDAVTTAGDPNDPYEFNTVDGGLIEVCIVARGLFTNGGFVEASGCGAIPTTTI